MSNVFTRLLDATDEELVVESLDGNLRAYDELVNRYQQKVAGTLYRFTSNQSELEDLVQETFIRAFRKLEKWKPGEQASFGAWLRRIGYNLACDHLRKQKRNPLNFQKAPAKDEEENTVQMDIKDETPQVDQLSANKDLIKWLLAQLKADESMLITLMYVEQLSVQEMAERTGWGISNVKVKIHRARKKLQKLFQDHEGLGTQHVATV
ncbi:MAG: sigma-70 family RNA polymerase sigma factor [Opitutales bacterium]|nr:sigma-70 family RNA polymerase sigma factor [Opitutales bacterium]